jgi:hypothetical protein
MRRDKPGKTAGLVLNYAADVALHGVHFFSLLLKNSSAATISSVILT